MSNSLARCSMILGLLLSGEAVQGSDVTWSAYQDAAAAAIRARDYPKAKRLYYEAAEEAARYSPGGGPELLLKSVLGLSAILIHEADYAQAEKLLKEAVKLAEPLGRRHPDIAQAHSDLALIHYRQHKLDPAEAEAREALDATDPNATPTDLATPLNNLANIERARKHYDAAEALARRAIAVAESANGPRSAEVAIGLDTLAEIDLDRGQREQALPLAEKALEIAAGSLAANHPFLADIQDTLADIHAAMGHKEKAVEHSAAAVEVNKANLHRDHHLLRESLEQLEQQLTAAGRTDQAAKLRADLVTRARRAATSEQPRSQATPATPR